MRRNKKGFTLIELLAVIVILAIIALIAVPVVLNLIEKARKGAAVDSAYGLRKSSQLYYSSGLLENPLGVEEIEFNCDGDECISNKKNSNGEFIKLDIDGTVPTSGKITVNPSGEMKFENIIYNNKYECIIEQSGPITCDGMKAKYVTIKTDLNGWSESKKVIIDYDSSCTDKQYSIDGTTWNEYTGEIEITQNVEVKAKATCDGKVVETNYTENKIDTSAPVLNEIPFSATKLSSTSLQIIVNDVIDDGEITGYAYSLDDGVSYSEIQENDIMIVNNLTPGATYKIKIKVYDATSKSVESENAKEVTLDALQEIEAKILPGEEVWSTSKTLEIINSNIYIEQGYKINYKYDEENALWNEYTDVIEVSKNENIIIGIFNGETLLKTTSFLINFIDTTAPTESTLEYIIEGNNIKVTASGVDNESSILMYQFSKDNGANWTAVQESEEYLYESLEEGTYNLMVRVINGTYINNGLNSNYLDSESIEVEMKASVKFVSVDAGTFSVSAIDEAGNLWVWGSNDNGQYGTGNTTNSLVPIQVATSNDFTKFKIDDHSLKIDKQGNLWSWGNNSFGTLGTGNTTNSLVPKQIMEDKTFIEISASGTHSLAIDSNNNLWGWGYNNDGQLGDGTRTQRNKPINILSDKKIIFIDCGPDRSTVIDEDGNLYSFGRTNTSNGASYVNSTPTLMSSTIKFIKAGAGSGFDVAIDKDNNLWSYGRNDYGQLGNGTMDFNASPTKIMEGKKFKDIDNGGYHVLALDTDDNLWIWGQNSNGQLGDGTTNTNPTPTHLMPGIKFIDIAAYNGSSYAVDKDGNLWSWGYGLNGKLGNGSTDDVHIPTKIIVKPE